MTLVKGVQTGELERIRPRVAGLVGAAIGTPAARPVPQPPVLGGYSLAPLMSQNPGGNLIGNAYGAVPAWARNPFQLGMEPNFANPNGRFPTGGFAAPGAMPQAAAPAAAPVKAGVNDGFGSGDSDRSSDRGPKSR